MQRAIRRWTQAAGARVALVIMICGLIVGAGLWAVNQGPAPQRWQAAIVAGLTDALGVPVTVDGLRIAGVNRIVLDGVELGGPVPLAAKRVVVGFAVGDLMRSRGAPLEALRWVHVDGWRAELPGDTWQTLVPAADDPGGRGDEGAVSGDSEDGRRAMPDRTVDVAALLQHLGIDREVIVRLSDGRVSVPAGQWTPPLDIGVRGNIVVENGRLQLERLVAVGPGWEAALTGALFPRPDVYAYLVSGDVAKAVAGMTWTTAVHTAGRVEAEAWLAGDWPSPQAWGRVRLHDAEVAGPTGPDTAGEAVHRYTADDVVVDWAYRTGHPVEVTVDAAKKAARLKAEGIVLPTDGAMNLTVTATDLDLPADVPVLGRWDVDGWADFHGTLTGTVRAPQLSGTVASDGGRLFGQPFSGLQGDLELTDERFSFARARIAQGTAVYHLEGVVAFASELEQRPARLELALRTDRGRVEALASVLGWEVPVQADLSGTMTFVGPFGAIGAEGEVAMSHGIAFGQPFDELAGRFQYGPDGFAVTDVVGSVRGGSVTAQGGGAVDGPWELRVGVDDVPMQAITAVRDVLPAASGLVGFDGVVRSDAGGQFPLVAGTVTGRHLLVGGVDFASAVGDVAFHGGELTTGGLTMARHRGGTYYVTGRIVDGVDAPVFDLSVDVENESLADVLALAGLRLPVPAAAGSVGASMTLSGTLKNPEARIRLEAPDVFVVGRRTALALELRLKDGRIEVEELSHGTVARQAVGG